MYIAIVFNTNGNGSFKGLFSSMEKATEVMNDHFGFDGQPVFENYSSKNSEPDFISWGETRCQGQVFPVKLDEETFVII